MARRADAGVLPSMPISMPLCRRWPEEEIMRAPARADAINISIPSIDGANLDR
jgi:hypothetical protein